MIPGDAAAFTQENDIPLAWEITNKDKFPGKNFNFEWKITDAANKDVFVVTWHDKNKFPKDQEGKCIANNGNDWICPWAIIPKGTLQPGAYTWSVEAGDGVKGYGWTNLGTFTVVPPEKPAFACANKWITLTGDSAANQVNLAWSNGLPPEYTDTTKQVFTDRTGKKIEKVTAAEKTYFVHRSENSAFEGEKVMPLMGTAASNYTDAEGLTAGKTYYYYIEGDKGTKAGYHYCSNVISITVSDKPVPGVPSVTPVVTLSAIATDSKVDLFWTDTGKVATLSSYKLTRAEVPNAFGTANSKLIAEFKPNAQGVVAMKYTDNGGGQNLQNC